MANPILPHPNMDFTPLDVLTAAELDQMVANIQYLTNFCKGLANGSNLDNGSVLFSKIRNTYSTTEEAIGKWIDGKTIYRKSATGTNLNFKNLGVTFDKITRTNMMVKTIQNEWRPIPWCYSAGSNVDGTWNAGYFIRQNGDLVFQFGNSIAQNFKEWVLIIEYTKP